MEKKYYEVMEKIAQKQGELRDFLQSQIEELGLSKNYKFEVCMAYTSLEHVDTATTLTFDCGEGSLHCTFIYTTANEAGKYAEFLGGFSKILSHMEVNGGLKTMEKSIKEIDELYNERNDYL